MSIQGLAWILLKAVGVNDAELLTLLQPTQGRFQSAPQEFDALRVLLRRMGHVLERSPGSIASSLRGHSAAGGTFLTETAAAAEDATQSFFPAWWAQPPQEGATENASWWANSGQASSWAYRSHRRS
jgi:hypothetical protein